MQYKLFSLALISAIMVVLAIGAVSATSFLAVGYGQVDTSLDSGLDVNANADASVRFDSDVEVDSDVDLSARGNGYIATLNNGTIIAILVTSAEARETAAASLEVRDCSNCTVEMEEERFEGQTRVVYDVETKKNAKILGFINADLEMSAKVDAETGAVLEVEKPWWSFLATVESSTSASSSSSAN